MKNEKHFTGIVREGNGVLTLTNGMGVFTHKQILSVLQSNQPFRSDVFCIFVVSDGELKIRCDLTTYTLKKNSLFYIFPGSSCEILQVSDNIMFEGLFFNRPYLEQHGVFLNSADFIHIFSEDMVRVHILLKQEYEDVVYSISSLKKKIKLPSETFHLDKIIRHSFVSVLYEVFLIFSRYNHVRSVKLNRQEELTSSFLSLLSSDFKNQRSVQYYAKALCITPRHLSKVVKQVTGKTAGELIDEMVIKEAKILLSGHVFSIAQVANELKFSNQSFFGKFFKRYTGLSPSDYKSENSII